MSKRQADRLNRLRREKRGVVLLVVVSILTLFLMIGVTYVLVAGNYNKAAGQALRAKTYGDESEREIEEVLAQVLYGTPSFGGAGPRSVISPHSLLQDLYGNDGVVGFIIPGSTINFTNSGQVIYVQVNFANPQPIPNYYAGRVITFTDGPAAGLSSRVMAYFPTGAGGGGTPELMVETPESDLPIPVAPSSGTRFIINGAPFNGTGAGFDPTVLNLEATITLNSGTPYYTAFLPNYPFYPAGAGNPALGGLDEQYDVPDYQNIFLAFVPPRKLQATVPSRVGNEQGIPPLPILPSFHRPDLVRFWENSPQVSQLLSGAANQRQAFLYPYGPDGIRGNADDLLGQPQADELVALKRMMIFRPLREDNPNFTGGNSNFLEDRMAFYDTDSDGMNGNDTDSDGDAVYDVDNDGDGIPESIWIDAGLPVVTAPNGRRYKRLVAICIKDLDGRVNPSVHGNQFLANNASARTITPLTDTFAGMNPNNPTPIYLPRGLGFGPAEVDFQHIFNNDPNVYINVLNQRYLPNVSGQAAFPGFSDGNPANANNHDGWSNLRMIGMPYDHTNPPLSGWSTPPDVWGRGAMAVDYTGQPLWYVLGTAERIDNPYEMQWDQLRASVDVPYTVSELEALLRYHDVGASVIPSRLMLPGPNGAGQYLAIQPRGTPGIDQIRRDAFGMGSYIPAPKLMVPHELRASFYAATGNYNPTLLDLYNFRLGGNTNQFQTIIPFEFFKGQMFNLNRELGNGQDDNGNFVIDEPGEYGSETIPTTAGPYPLNYLNDTPPANTPDQRQMYARHLYCLMMLLRNGNKYDTDLDGTPTQAETARLFAQWAVNVVDFRDPDSIMTRFEYDIDPFDANGWSVDGDPNTPVAPADGGVVWGCERPELLLTETIVGHDRRTEDLDDDPSKHKTTDAVNKDDDYDQRLLPQGWAFIELYNPWYDRGTGGNPNVYDHKPSEIYANGGVDISKVNNGGSPVWRMIVLRSDDGVTHSRVDPDSPQPDAITMGLNGNPSITVDRTIYFADLNAGGVIQPGGAVGEVYFPSGSIPRVPIAAGRYAVIGSSGTVDNAAGTYTTYIGRRTDASTGFDPALLNLPMTRRIVLNPTAQTVQVLDNRNAGANDVNAADFQSVVALPVDSVMRGGASAPQSFNITEPINGYLANPPPAPSVWQPPGPNDEGHFSPSADAPFDVNRGAEYQFLATDATKPNFRTVCLQRLANPLLPWHPVINPYMTIDKSCMDVLPYNGVTDDAADPQLGGGIKNLQSFQRGGRFLPTDPEAVTGYTTPAPTGYFRRLWQQEDPFVDYPLTGDSPTEAGTGPHYQPRPLFQTLGYLNKRYHPYFDATAPAIYRGAPSFQDPTGAIAPPFPYFPFNNRPFNNPMELLQVSCWHSSKVLENHGFEKSAPVSANWINLYQPINPLYPNSPYGHLLNFFNTSTNPNGASNAAEIGRLLDYVETRTPYISTEKYYNPAPPVNFAGDPNTPAGYRPPFNYLSRFREPGRININTIFDDNVWNAAVRGFPGMCSLAPPEGDNGLFLSHLVLSRQGYGQSGADILQHNPAYPSLFSDPFRTADSADMMPPVPAQLRRSPADGGLLRRDLNQYPPTVPPMTDAARPLFASDNTLPYQDASRNAYFRYQGLQKIGNLFSTNSNCYAVWITVGYFEVEANDADNNSNTPAQIDAAHPDGLRLAQEVGVDEGNVKRHRAFFIIDRSIPVGYEPGHRHNTDKAVLLKRFIE